ncbi:hypothetical protein HPB48_019235 [Haemaphysalis longicornis]|uniref:F-box domain-containing protein n=1 Tax=Haemaphysalis longicornis TaxID=44386 RepID=A0A9J6F6J2_HAELO|nr:hypothetical protein HPB48_019235 [Haemaphysalis longicornis]
MAVASCDCDYSRLPHDIWLRILSYADTDVLLAMEATASCFTDIVRHEHLLSNIVCAPSSDDGTFQRFFTTRTTCNVKVLDVSNCIVAAPDVIFSWVRTCHALAELRCVNCPVPYSTLLMALMEWLPQLKCLHWSFFGKNLSDGLMRRFTAAYSERAVPQLCSTYVEVACQGADNHALLSFLLRRCIVLQELHLHGLYGDFTIATAACIGAATFPTAWDAIFVYSAELDVLRGEQPYFASRYLRLWQLPSNCSDRASACANQVCLRASTAGASYSRARAKSESVEIPRFKHVVVTLSNEVGVQHRLSEVALEMTWTHIEVLALEMLPYPASYTASYAGSMFRTPLIMFLNSFPVLTELNVNSFHFAGGMDCCHVLAAIPVRLRALSLAPCGINRAYSVRNLAKVSSKLEELDVRVNCDNVSLHCAFCCKPFRVRGADAALLQQRSLLSRFTLFGVLKVRSLEFIANLRTSELRLSFMADWDTVSLTYNDCNVLSCNDNLRSLVLRDSAVQPVASSSTRKA